jgi:hypothetical protein
MNSCGTSVKKPEIQRNCGSNSGGINGLSQANIFLISIGGAILVGGLVVLLFFKLFKRI